MYYWTLADVSHWGIASSFDKRGDETENLSSQADINLTCAMLAAPCCRQQELLVGRRSRGTSIMKQHSREATYTLTEYNGRFTSQFVSCATGSKGKMFFPKWTVEDEIKYYKQKTLLSTWQNSWIWFRLLHFCSIPFVPPSHMLAVLSSIYRCFKLKAYRFDYPLPSAADVKRNSCPRLTAGKLPGCPFRSAVSVVDAALHTLQFCIIKPKNKKTKQCLLVQRYITEYIKNFSRFP